MLGYVLAELCLTWVFLAPHENHVFEKVGEPWPLFRIIKPSSIDRYRTVTHLLMRLILFINENTFNSIFKIEPYVLILVVRTLLKCLNATFHSNDL